MNAAMPKQGCETPMPDDYTLLPQDHLCLEPKFNHRADGLGESRIRRLMERSMSLDAVPIFLVDGNAHAIGGFATIEALRRKNWEFVTCKVVGNGTFQEAFEASLAQNANNGAERSDRDLRQAIMDAWEYSQENRLKWTNRTIAKLVDCSHSRVNQVLNFGPKESVLETVSSPAEVDNSEEKPDADPGDEAADEPTIIDATPQRTPIILESDREVAVLHRALDVLTFHAKALGLYDSLCVHLNAIEKALIVAMV